MEIEYNKEHGVERTQNKQVLLVWGDCHNIGFMFDPTKIAAFGCL